MQTCLDASGGIQTVALLASLNPARAQGGRTARWVDAYRDPFDDWKLFHHRCRFDMERGWVLHEAVESGKLLLFRWTAQQMTLRCNYCSKPLSPPLSNNFRVSASVWRWFGLG